MRRLVLLPLLLLALPASAGANTYYVLKRPKHEHCRAHYTKKVETVKEHKRHRTVKVRETLCIHVAPKKAMTVGPAHPATPTPAQAIKLHAHLDPSFTRDPSDPLKVTYAYSASATSELVGNDEDALNAQPAPLPEGVLSLYSNGTLACAINVGGETTGGECPVTYAGLGAQTVTTIYTSGSTSATETETEAIEPLGSVTTVTAGYEHLGGGPQLYSGGGTTIVRECPASVDGWRSCYVGTWKVGRLTIHSVTINTQDESLEDPSVTLGGVHAGMGSWEATVYITAWETTCPPASPKCDQPALKGETGDLESPAVTGLGVPFTMEGEESQVAVQASYESSLGYAPSGAEATVAVTSPVVSP